MGVLNTVVNGIMLSSGIMISCARAAYYGFIVMRYSVSILDFTLRCVY